MPDGHRVSYGMGDGKPRLLYAARSGNSFDLTDSLSPREQLLLAEINRWRLALGRQSRLVERVVCEALGWEEDPGYGFPTGDHTAETLVALLADEYRKLQGVARALREALGDFWVDPCADETCAAPACVALRAYAAR